MILFQVCYKSIYNKQNWLHFETQFQFDSETDELVFQIVY